MEKISDIRAYGPPDRDYPAYLTTVYIIAMLLVFPLYLSGDRYVHVLQDKYALFFYLTLGYLALLLLTYLLMLATKRAALCSPAALWRASSWPQRLVALFLLVCTASALLSQYFPSTWEGLGRMDGLRTWLLYGAVFLCLSGCAKMHRAYLYAFAFSMMVFCLIGLLQYYGLNPFGLYGEGMNYRNISFISTIGNTNIACGMLCLALPLFICGFVLTDGKQRYAFLPVAMLVFYVLYLIRVDAGVAGTIAALLITAPFLLNTPCRLRRGAVCGAALALTAAAASFFKCTLTTVGFIPLFKFSTLTWVFLAAALLCAACYLWLNAAGLKFAPTKRQLGRFWLIVGVLLILAFLAFLWFYPVSAPQSGSFFEMSQILHGDAEGTYGSNRVFIWHRAVWLIPEHPLLGSGPDTFLAAFKHRFQESIWEAGYTVFFDFAHNDYLQIAVNVGLLGLAAYLAALFAQVRRCLRYEASDSAIGVLAAAMVCYCAQAFFSFSIVIVAPLFWLIWGLLEACCRSEAKKVRGSALKF